MTVFDYIAIAIIAGSVLMALMRGLIAEVLSLGSWLIAFWCAKQFSPLVTDFLPSSLQSEGLRMVAGFVLVFFLVWLATALLRVTLTGLVDSIGLGAINRLLGGVFGLARGMVLVTALVLLGGLSSLPQKPMWRNAVLAAPFESLALSLRPWLPPTMADNLHYDSPGGQPPDS
ncbi:CvpA family protein [Chromobacterium violaceum]|uniref:Pur regulon 18 kDa protein n=2 Tax=Chromobacterium violaceum TaxID=536 RepID=A0AAX2M8U0_CHRVL|nr:CvpA family protein [Chromobacterium violaceum]AAQ60187.1 probable colicin V production protein [Chromobacterium violaceum ATCC 12472]ATP28961.1 colicin V production protein [Chromobacterium violaceum]ATP32872.1 colicin V production protein [Chromobacterium violaceum]KJH67857.1 colicin V production protein [Chromobacterium violaceum]KMN49259.1 colicin V production protein [Chromobacterium violaceum]